MSSLPNHPSKSFIARNKHLYGGVAPVPTCSVTIGVEQVKGKRLRQSSKPLMNNENNREISSTKPEQVVCNESMAETKGETGHARQIVVVIKSYRRRLLDPDNLTGGTKYFVDGCRYAGLIPGDKPDQITLQVSQEKVKSKDQERTEIEIL